MQVRLLPPPRIYKQTNFTIMNNYVVSAYKQGSGAGYRAFFYHDEKKARDKRAELLSVLPSDYVVNMEKEEKI